MTRLPPPLGGLYWGPERDRPPRCLVVLCHGVGADEHQLASLSRAWATALPELAFAAPRAPLRYRTRRSRWLPWARSEGYAWFSLVGRSPATREAEIRTAAAALGRFVDAALRRFELPPDAYALAGFSQGAMIALFAGLRQPVAPRAILSYAGGLLAPTSLPAEIRGRAPVLLVHGEADEVVPVSRSRGAEIVLRGLGAPVDSVYPAELGHAIDVAGRGAGAAFLCRVLGRERSGPKGQADTSR